MASLSEMAREQTDLDDADVDHLHALVADWTLLSDLALSDLVLWLPTWNGAGFVAGAQVRATTAPTVVPQDLVGDFVPRARRPELERAVTLGLVVRQRSDGQQMTGIEAVPVSRGGRVIAVVARHVSQASRVVGPLENIYLEIYDDLAAMVAAGSFPASGVATTGKAPRVGDGLIRLDSAGRVTYASPNAVSAFRRLGLAPDLLGADLASVAVRLSHRPGTVDEALGLVASGRAAGGAEIDNRAAVVTIRSVPILRGGESSGALVLVRDVTELRRRDRALLTKDATIREIHHRVKNNLQTVAALLRLQARRLDQPGAREALEEAVRRIGSIAVVHDTLARDLPAGAAAPAGVVDFDDVCARVVALVTDLAAGHGAEGGVPSVMRAGEVGQLPADQATPLAMVLSELLQNAMEHAGARAVVVEAGRPQPGRLRLVVRDDGIGLPEGFEPPPDALGLQIVQTLVVDELGGSLEFQPGHPGTVAQVDLPVG